MRYRTLAFVVALVLGAAGLSSIATADVGSCDSLCSGPCTGFLIRSGTCQSSTGQCVCVPNTPAPGECALACDGRPCVTHCMDGTTASGFCTDLTVDTGCDCSAACGTPTPSPPPVPTPTPQCASDPCGGTCGLCPPCTPGTICPKAACFIGHCDMVSGSCACVPGVLTPTPTPTPTVAACDPLLPQCPVGTTCGCCCGVWQCLLPDTICCEIACTVSTPPPTGMATPTATPTPTFGMRQSCEATPCPSGFVCVTDPALSSKVCDCIGDCGDNYKVTVDELVLLVNVALGKAPVSMCELGDVSGDGEISVDEILQAVSNALYGCRPPNQTPTPTNTPNATPVLPHGHTCCECGNAACTDVAWVEVEPVCPLGCQMFMNAECEAPCHPGPQSAPATCAVLTPCTTEADCDDGNGCTIDQCTLDGCTHACVCD
jgi:hypothetical protein